MRETADFRALSDRTLTGILKLNGGTLYGRENGLDGPAPRSAFEELPTTTYADYVPYIERIAAGEQNVMTAEPVVYFATTSGTTGPPKMIPVTQRRMRISVQSVFRSMGLALRTGALTSMRGPFMQIVTDHAGLPTAGGIPTGAVTTAGFRSLGSLADVIFSSPADVRRVPDQGTARYLHLLFGLREERLWTIASFFPATILFAMRDLQENAERLLRDVADGTVDQALDLPADIHSRLRRRLRPAPARARALEALLDRDQLTVGGIWPRVGAILTVTGGAFHFYVEQLRPLLGGVSTFSPLYIASEGTFGYGYLTDEPHYLLLPALSYIELLPVEVADDSNARPLPAWQAEPGRSYEVVVTTWDGLVRYRLQDIVRIVRFEGQTPVIEFVERRGQLIDILGEKTSEHRIVDAIDRACHAWEEPLVDYVVAPATDTTPARYVLAIEEWRGDCENHLRARQFVRALDMALREIAPDYSEECELGTLGPMALVMLRAGAFERLRERGVAAGGPASQIKTPHVIPDPTYIHREFRHEILVRT